MGAMLLSLAAFCGGDRAEVVVDYGYDSQRELLVEDYDRELVVIRRAPVRERLVVRAPVRERIVRERVIVRSPVRERVVVRAPVRERIRSVVRCH